MSATPIGDLAQIHVSRLSHTRLRSELSRLGTELTTGLKQDVASATRGDTRSLTAIERQIAELDAYALARTEAGLRIGTASTSIDAIRQRLSRVADEVTTAIQGSDPSHVAAVGAEARQAFLGAIGDLNVQAAGNSIFAGTNGTGAALRSGPAVLADIVTAATGSTTAAEVAAAIDAYFAPGGAFEVNDYIGGAKPPALRLGSNEQVAAPPRADDPALRESLATLAKLAVLDSGVLAGNGGEAQKLAVSAQTGLLQADRNLVGIAATLGVAEARIETAAASATGQRAGFEMARLDILSADPFETAVRLEQTESQIEALYTLTARMSRLSLTNYL